MSMAVEVLVSLMLVVGGLFGLVGSIGLLKLRGAMQRLHAPTKGTTVGVGAVLIASALDGWGATGSASWHEVLVMIFLFTTAPLTALFLAKAHVHAMTDRNSLPSPGTGADWANAPDQLS